jgi:hypothetical protein
MTRYFFDITFKGRDYRDWKGRHFLDLKAAKAHAAKIARELAQNSSLYLGGSICIADEHGEELHRALIGDDVTRVD